MDYELLKSFIDNHIAPYLYHIEVWQCITALDIKPEYVNKHWYFSYYENDQKIIGYGRTIDNAACDFYNNLKTQNPVSYD